MKNFQTVVSLAGLKKSPNHRSYSGWLLLLLVLVCLSGCQANARKGERLGWGKPLSTIRPGLQWKTRLANQFPSSRSLKPPEKKALLVQQPGGRGAGAATLEQEKIQAASFDETEKTTEISLAADPNSETTPTDPTDPRAVSEPILPLEGSSWNLNQLIAICLGNDPALGIGIQEIQQAYAEQVTASLRPNPDLEILQSLLPLGRPFDASIGREGGPPQFDVMLSFPIDWYVFGKRAAAMRAASRGRRASELEFVNLVRERVLQVSLAFFDVLEQENLLELAEQDVENLREVERVTQIAVTNGAMPVVELNRIKLDRLSGEQTLRETRRDLMAAKAGLLNTIGGVGEPTNFRLLGNLEGIEKGSLPNLDDLFQLAQTNRPDILALQARIDEARANIEVECREQYADLEPVFGYTRQFQEKAIDFPDVSSWGVGLRMSLPFYDRNQGNRLRANSEYIQQQEEFRLGLVELRSELIEVIADLETARDNAISTGEEQIQLAEEVRDGIRKAYEAGGRPLIDVLDSQRNFRETVRNSINSRADYWRAVQRYNAALAIQVIE
jgi:cobalt-zinc-cadmium efflux system outer membrane protein